MPGIAVAGVRASGLANDTDRAVGIDHAVIQDAAGRLYDVYASDTDKGRERLSRRVKAAKTLDEAREPAGLGFTMDRVLAFANGSSSDAATGDTAVMVTAHHDGQSRPLDMLTVNDCASVGTAIGAIHRLRSDFLTQAGYPTFTTGQIRAQLTAWIARLRAAGHIPTQITDSWSRILDTEGLWSFHTVMVHGGFSEGDLLFSGSTITSITNWQGMQVNDPARDLAWIFAKLDEDHRNAVLAAYGRMMGSRLDDLIMLRANLWLQMEQVGDFIQALNRADSVAIMQFKAQVDRLAHQLDMATTRGAQTRDRHQDAGQTSRKPPSTITVGTLLDESERRRAAREQTQTQAPTGHGTAAAQSPAQQIDADRTGSADIHAQGVITPSHYNHHDAGHVASGPSSQTHTLHQGTAETMIVPRLDASTLADGIGDELADETNDNEPAANTSVTMVIPLQERQERALRDAHGGLDDPSAHQQTHQQTSPSDDDPAPSTDTPTA
ncbi:phosphotransferase [Bifidobacterium jacchi]|uniref:phosphotransferase n=1 Tax=Bifidobacterium jacchi TaxID=2490545 RepID=UPI001F5040B4|nr:phosphotransferase [Bifidobacterium jacchi]